MSGDGDGGGRQGLGGGGTGKGGQALASSGGTGGLKQEAGMVAVPGGRRKAVVLISCGIDTFSKINHDQARKIVQNARVSLDEVLYAGDDLPDLAPMAHVAISAAPSLGKMNCPLELRNSLTQRCR